MIDNRADRFKKKSFSLENDDEVQISKDDGLKYEDIVIWQLRRMTVLSNVEFRGGFYTTVPSKDGEEKEIYVQDTREVFSNGVYALALLLKPFFKNNMKKVFKRFNEQLQELTQEFIEKSSVDEEVVLGEAFYDNENDKILLETYKNKKLKLYLVLFSHLANMFKKGNPVNNKGMYQGVF